MFTVYFTALYKLCQRNNKNRNDKIHRYPPKKTNFNGLI